MCSVDTVNFPLKQLNATAVRRLSILQMHAACMLCVIFFFFFFRLLGYFYKKDTALILFSCISNGSTAVLLTVQETNGMEYQNTEHLMLFTFFLNLIAFCFPRLFFFFFFSCRRLCVTFHW